MSAGTNARRVRRALVDALTPRLDGVARVHYAAPVDPDAMTTPTGELAAVWTAYRSASIDLNVFAAPALVLDETVTIEVVCQVLRLDGTDQDTVDELGEDLLGAVLAEIRTDPTLSTLDDTDELLTFDVVPTGWSVDDVDNGVVGDNPGHRGARFRITVEATARLNLV